MFILPDIFFKELAFSKHGLPNTIIWKLEIADFVFKCSADFSLNLETSFVNEKYHDWMNQAAFSVITTGITATRALFDLVPRAKKARAPHVPNFKETAACSKGTATLDGDLYMQSR